MQRITLSAESAIRLLKRKYPWLVAEWNGALWESEREITRRRLHALEAHIRNLEDRYAELEDRFNYHTQGQRHRSPKPKLPPADTE